MTFHLMFIDCTFSSVLVAEWPSFGKELPSRLAVCSLCILSICNFSYFLFGLESRGLFLIAPVHVLCLLVTFNTKTFTFLFITFLRSKIFANNFSSKQEKCFFPTCTMYHSCRLIFCEGQLIGANVPFYPYRSYRKIDKMCVHDVHCVTSVLSFDCSFSNKVI